MKSKILMAVLALLTFCTLNTAEQPDCPTPECLQHGCELAELAQRLQIPTENWAEFARQFRREAFCADLSCCCSDGHK